MAHDRLPWSRPKRQWQSHFGTCGIHALVSLFSFARAVLSINLSLQVPVFATSPTSSAGLVLHACIYALCIPAPVHAVMHRAWRIGAPQLSPCLARPLLALFPYRYLSTPHLHPFLVSPQTWCPALPAVVKASAYGPSLTVAALTALAHRV